MKIKRTFTTIGAKTGEGEIKVEFGKVNGKAFGSIEIHSIRIDLSEMDDKLKEYFVVLVKAAPTTGEVTANSYNDFLTQARNHVDRATDNI